MNVLIINEFNFKLDIDVLLSVLKFNCNQYIHTNVKYQLKETAQ